MMRLSEQFLLAFQSMLSMPYFKNEAAKSGSVDFRHESSVASYFEKAGFRQHLHYAKISKPVISNWMKTGDTSKIQEVLKDVPNGSYLLQPLGTQAFPDMIIKDFTGEIEAVECKSAKKSAPMWNDNHPKLFGIYIFSNEEVNGTTFFLGGDVISSQQIKAFQEVIDHLNGILNEKLEAIKLLDTSSRGFSVRIRQQFYQRGSKSIVDYFSHSKKKECEDRVFQYIRGEIDPASLLG